MAACGAAAAEYSALLSLSCGPITRRRFAVSCRARPPGNLSAQQKKKRGKNIAPKQRSSNAKLLLTTEENGQLPSTSLRTSMERPQKSTSSEDDTNGAISQIDEKIAAIGNEQQERSKDKHFESDFQLEDFGEMIQNMEKNILLLNQARLQAIEDVDKILTEKEALQKKVDTLEMNLSKALATKGNINTDIPGDHLEKFTKEILIESALSGGNPAHLCESPLFMELTVLKEENMLLKADAQFLKAKIVEFAETEEFLFKLEKERSLLDATVRELEARFLVAQTDIWKVVPLQYDVWMEKVENLQHMLGCLKNHVEKYAALLDQHDDLHDKIDELEASLKEGKTSEFSPYVVELLQQKLKAAKSHHQAGHQETNTHIQVYQQLTEEFQDNLGKLIEESGRLEHSANSMPSEFWSHILLMIDGWFLERKIPNTDARMLREMAWKRDDRICEAYFACKGAKESDVMETFLKLSLSGNSSGLHIVHIAAEMAPVAKVGGLADVVAGLGKALQTKGHLVEIVLPKYDCMQLDQITNLKVLDVVIQSYFDGNLFSNNVWTGTVEGLPVYFIEPQHPSKFFWRAQYYGEHDDFKRYSYFSRAALELLYQSGKKIDIIHCHDWQTAFVAPLYWDIYATRGFSSARICFTCHNFEYQGTAPAPDLSYCGLDVEQLDRPDRMQDNAHGRINVAKGGIVYSNIVTTVSPTYALEVRSEGGRGLQDTLKMHSRKFVGILNGIDTGTWNPSTDRFLAVQYSATDLQGKAANKAFLRKQLGLYSEDASQPLVACITRLVPQKGLHLIRHAIYKTAELGGQFVLLGSSPVPHIQREFEGVADQFQKNNNIRLILKYDEALSHCIYAASDMFIIPSMFEPCGLTQMIAMRYGSVPIVRQTGGLCDSVFDFDDETIPVELRNGFTFARTDEQDLSSCLERAFSYYSRKPMVWKQLVQKDMQIDFSWDSPASQYENLYQSAVAQARGAAQT
ncbi:glycogen (starch) synthase-like [Oryza sativa Japonica Group]|uniref:Starch synthase, chloroplastic/amyloplastic n=2 Tax=Oryza sativa subsp. japonica TaxID=39947 RepID=Q6UBQ7_ORYSJ|nr:probable starch synthase 4, chloroplastic/amyloplastic isoform X2 [Oryza sativa Japonica Group]AAQ82622.1 starch synthase IVa precursor [Oryza sativa Japonica Group]BAD87397.1 glycogen (starch) synthase-like [Oryza sativa Japonica Group]BAF06005.1 Os01g0720600 [Oryza sativa Japonica Group]BAS74075.1 Os01g0720600 [Oryza sativa Japonica Group]|eukprot:NP_001044091.1 Os01g0720600 [Oryza sativa Japonica Group]